MWISRLMRSLSHSGYDRHGNVKYLLDRSDDPHACDLNDVPAGVRDEALRLICESFDIPQRQMHCLRPDDELLAIYHGFVGPRNWDDMEFERLGLAIDDLPGPKLTDAEREAVKTISDILRIVAVRRLG